MVPARTIGTNRRSLTGRVTHQGQSHSFESSLERDFYTLLRFNPAVSSFQEQPVTIRYRDSRGRHRRYTPDVLVYWKDGTSPALYEVKYHQELADEFDALRPRFKAAIGYARSRGWVFHIITDREIRSGNLLANAQFLTRYAAIEHDCAVELHLLRCASILGPTTPEEILVAAYRTDRHRMQAIPFLWRLLAEGSLAANLDEPLTMTSPIWVPEVDYAP